MDHLLAFTLWNRSRATTSHKHLTEFVDDVVGVPGTLICNFSTEQTGKNTEVMKVLVQHNNQIWLTLTEKGRGTTLNHRAETKICEIKTKWKTRMHKN